MTACGRISAEETRPSLSTTNRDLCPAERTIRTSFLDLGLGLRLLWCVVVGSPLLRQQEHHRRITTRATPKSTPTITSADVWFWFWVDSGCVSDGYDISLCSRRKSGTNGGKEGMVVQRGCDVAWVPEPWLLFSIDFRGVERKRATRPAQLAGELMIITSFGTVFPLLCFQADLSKTRPVVRDR